MYKLFYFPGNANLAPHMVLEEIGAPHELVLVDRRNDGHRNPEYLKLNPNGRIPTLVDGDLVLFESAAICLHLADRHPEAGLAPAVGTVERAHFYKWLIHLTNTIQPELLTFFYPERHTTNEGGVPAVKSMADRRLGEMWRLIDAQLEPGPYLLGSRFGAADLFLAMLARWSRRTALPPRELPRLARLLDLIHERPAVQRACAAEGLEPPYF